MSGTFSFFVGGLLLHVLLFQQPVPDHRGAGQFWQRQLGRGLFQQLATDWPGVGRFGHLGPAKISQENLDHLRTIRRL